MHEYYIKHKHTIECQKRFEDLAKCRQEHSFRRIFGYCNEYENVFNACLKKEFEKFKEANKIKGKRRSDQYKNLMKAYDGNRSFLKDSREVKQVVNDAEEKAEKLRKEGDKL